MKTTKSDRTKIIQDCLLVNEQNRLLCKRNWVKITANMQIAIVSFYRFRKVESFVLQLVKVKHCVKMLKVLIEQINDYRYGEYSKI